MSLRVALPLAILAGYAAGQEIPPMLITNAHILTVNPQFAVARAMAVTNGRIAAVGGDALAASWNRPGVRVLNLEGRTVLPGLIDSHVHPAAAMTEFDHDIPSMETVEDVLEYIRGRAAVVPDGGWIVVQQVFITRLREPRYPTRAELDRAAPRHPVVFRTGPDAVLNGLALARSRIDRDFAVTDGGSGFVEMDSATGEPTGLIRNGSRFIRSETSERAPAEADYLRRTRELFRDYNRVGLTAVGDRAANEGSLLRYRTLRDAGQLTVRVMASWQVDSLGPMAGIEARIESAASHPLRRSNDWVRIIGIKTFLDGGMLTGSAYMREPWGVSEIYAIADPDYRGVRFIPPERLDAMVRAAARAGLQFTAHSVGDGAVHGLLETYGRVSQEMDLRSTRPCITHCNFMSREAIDLMAQLGVSADIQPVWLHLDAHTLVRQFGTNRLRWFQPLRSLFEAGVVAGGGSDHMQKIGAERAINPYSPWLGMATALSRSARRRETPLHAQESLTREQVIRFYTVNNAFLLFLDHAVGSLEPGKLADFIVVDRDPLTCPVSDLRETQVLAAYVNGVPVFESNANANENARR